MNAVQGRVNDPRGAGTIWVSPLRDVAHFLPHLALSALDELAVECDTKYGRAEVDKFAAQVQTFIRLAADTAYPDFAKAQLPSDAFELSALYGKHAPRGLIDAYNSILGRRLFSFYFVGAREAFHPGENNGRLQLLLCPPARKQKSTLCILFLIGITALGFGACLAAVIELASRL